MRQLRFFNAQDYMLFYFCYYAREEVEKKSVKFSLKKCCNPHGDAKVFLLSVCCLLILVDSAIRLWRKEEKKKPSDMLGSY